MKMTTRILLSLALCLSFSLGQAQEAYVLGDYNDRNQDISELPKMDRDIYILQNILNDLFTGSNNNRIYSSRRSKGIYIPNNGVIFDISGNSVFGSTGYQSWDDLVVLVDGETTGLSKNFTEEELEKLNQEKENKLKELSATFLSNYGSLLSELKDSEKIQISVNYALHVRSTSRKIDGQLAFVSSTKDINKRRLVSMVSVKDIKDFEAGRISMSQLESKIESKTSNVDDEDMVDAKILAGIFDDLFRRSYDGYLSRSGRTSWTYFEGFGLMYNINLSSRSNGWTMRTIDSGQVVVSDNKTVKADEFYKDIQEKYDAFESAVKENIVKYGRTLRSLSPNEVVIVNLNVSANKNSNIPKTIQFMVPKSSIDAFAKGQKTLDQVKNEIDIKKLAASLNGSGFPTVIQGVASDVQYVEAREARVNADRVVYEQSVAQQKARERARNNN